MEHPSFTVNENEKWYSDLKDILAVSYKTKYTPTIRSNKSCFMVLAQMN